MNRKRITVPADQIKKRRICRQCGQDRYGSETARDGREKDTSSHRRDNSHDEHVYPHPDTWEP